MPPLKQGQGPKEEAHKVSPYVQEEEASLLTPKRAKTKTPIKKTRRQKAQRKVTPIPLVPETIPEEDEEDEEDNLPLSQRTHLAREIEVDGKRSSTIIPPSIPTNLFRSQLWRMSSYSG